MAMTRFKCPKCGRITEARAAQIWCPPQVRHPKGYGKHLGLVEMRKVTQESA